MTKRPKKYAGFRITQQQDDVRGRQVAAAQVQMAPSALPRVGLLCSRQPSTLKGARGEVVTQGQAGFGMFDATEVLPQLFLDGEGTRALGSLSGRSLSACTHQLSAINAQTAGRMQRYERDAGAD